MTAVMTWKSTLGWLGIEAGEGGVRRVVFDPQDSGLCDVAPQGESPSAPQLLHETRRQIDAYLAEQLREFDLPLDLSGCSAFARKVLGALATVPFGSTISYGALAQLAGSAGSARAVGRVMAANPLPILIPCHRVLPASGALGHYSGGKGAATKRDLLQLEGVDVDGLIRTGPAHGGRRSRAAASSPDGPRRR